MAYTASLASLIVAFASLAHTQNLQVPFVPDTQFPIPLLGYGTWNLDKSNVSDAVSFALQTGYRHLDCAAIYNNQKDVGKGIAEGLDKIGLDRGDIWVTSKLWNDHHGTTDNVEEGLDITLADLGLEYLDLYLMHWPVSSADGPSKLEYLDTWHAMEKLLDTGKVRYIGVSNFDPPQLKDLIEHSRTKPAVHQFELHPYLQQTKWVQWHKDHGIHVTAYSPLANVNPTYGAPSDEDDPPLLLANEVLTNIALIRGCTPAQVALAWGIHRGTSVIPKSSHALYIEENFRSTSCALQDSDYEEITDLGKKYLKRFNNPSDGYGVPLFKGLDDA
ncbi:MAG: hypothetical protein Q9191_004660 [Dirinaria sp. TL-2023a]